MWRVVPTAGAPLRDRRVIMVIFGIGVFVQQQPAFASGTALLLCTDPAAAQAGMNIITASPRCASTAAGSAY